MNLRRSPVYCVAIVLTVSTLALTGSGCRKKPDTTPALATPSFSTNHPRAPLGSPMEVTYRFAVAPGAHLDQNYRVMVHFLDADDQLMWTDDHNPPTPTTQWKPNQTIEYTRTVFIPNYPYIGDASVEMGLYSLATQNRVKLEGKDTGQRAYRVAKIQLLPQTENVFLIFKDGWWPAEISENNAAVEWQWTKRASTLAFRNPKRDCTLYLHLDRPGAGFQEQQTVTVQTGGKTLDNFTVGPRDEVIRKIRMTAAELGSADMVDVKLLVDKTFVPALLPASNSRDPRELGVRVFHAFVEPRL